MEPMSRDTIAALFRRALQPRANPADVERRQVEKLVSRAIERHQVRQLQRSVRALFTGLLPSCSNMAGPTALMAAVSRAA
jgi:hypothetical protein